MRRRIGTVLLCLAGMPAAAEMRLGGIAELEAATETADGRAQKAELVLLPELDWRTPFGFDLTAVGRLRADAYDRLEPGEPEQPAVGDWSRRHFPGDRVELELRELFIDAYLGDSYLRLGKQQIVWGEADGLKVLDLVNPQSFREFILDDFEDSRIPLWSVKWEVSLDNIWNAQLLLIPDQTYHEVPDGDAVFALSSPELVPAVPAGVPVTAATREVPDRPLADADVGVQLGAHLNGWDVTVNYLYHYADSPVVRLTGQPGGVVLDARYERTHTMGGTLANAFGDLTVRAEGGYSSNRYFPAPGAADGVVQSGEVSYVLGFDWMGFTDTLASLQIFQSFADVDGRAARDRVETDATLLLERTFANDTVTLSVLAIHDVDRGDGQAGVEVRYAYRANLVLRLALDVFYGPDEGRFGQFDARDRLVLGVEYGL